jgi:inner membrane protease ATP23
MSQTQDSSQATTLPPTTTAPSGPTKDEEKDQKMFERWRKTLSLITGVGLSQEEFQAEVQKADQKQCELRKEKLIKNSMDPPSFLPAFNLAF